MASISLSTLRTRIRVLGSYANSRIFTDAVLTVFVNEAIGEYRDLLDERWEGYHDKTGTVSTVANTATVAVPADFLKARAVDRLDDGRYMPLTKIQIRQTYAYEGVRDKPLAYMQVGANLELFPTPNAVYTLRLRYVPAMTALSADVDTIDVPNGWEDFIIHTALLKCDEREEKPTGERLAAIERARQRIIRAAEDRNVAEPDYVPFPGEENVRWFL